MRSLLHTIFATLLLFSISLEAQEKKSMVDLVNQQKTLLQQIIKEYAFLGMGNSFQNSNEQLPLHIKSYNENFALLKKELTSKESATILKKSATLWSAIEKDFAQTPSKERVLALQKEADLILQEMSALMREILKTKNTSLQEIINISGYQGVIVERMASLYMIKTWGVDDPKFNFKMRESITFFNNSLHKMLESPHTSQKNRETINKVMRSFQFFEVMNRSKTKFIPTLIYSNTLKISKQIQEITQTYIQEGES
jgi:hypothetical protein